MGLFNYVVRFITPTKSNDIQNAQWEYDLRASDLEFEQKHLEFCRHRTTPPRCLTCGSANVIDLERYLEDGRTEYPRRVGFQHPECGGTLWIKRSRASVIARHVTRYYTPEGKFIREEVRYPEASEYAD